MTRMVAEELPTAEANESDTDPVTPPEAAPEAAPPDEEPVAAEREDSTIKDYTAPEPEQPELEVVREGMGWYVLRVASNREGQVREALERKVKIEQLEER
ncbi:MAG: hypothetical protein KKI02_08740, partial [Planctomycetes bacterium]|nr:hypothetical protein [Planctomycetota bacterium]